jgi:hypothetical protein
MGQQLTVALHLDTNYRNVFTVYPAGYNTTKYRFNITNIELFVAFARMSQLGERALMERPKAPLAQYPGMYVKQYKMFTSTGDIRKVFSVPDTVLPSHILVQAFNANLLNSNNTTTETNMTRAISHQLKEVLIKFNDEAFHVSQTHPGKLNKEMRLSMRRKLFEKPFFQMPCHPDIGKGDIENYSHPHALFDLSNGAGQRMKTLNPDPDKRKGVISIYMEGDHELGLREFYLITFIYNSCGVIIDRANKTFFNSYFALKQEG